VLIKYKIACFSKMYGTVEIPVFYILMRKIKYFSLSFFHLVSHVLTHMCVVLIIALGLRHPGSVITNLLLPVATNV
jgi:hypothetical protein